MNIKQLLKKAEQRDLSDYRALGDLFEVCRILEETDYDLAHKYSEKVRNIAAHEAVAQSSGAMLEIYGKTLLFDALDNFDAYCQYIEWNREPKKRFYFPRRKRLKPIADSLEALNRGDIELLAISLPPGVGKTSLALFYLTWLAGKYPNKPILTGSHSNAFLRGAYDECLRIMDKKGEYLWGDVFPGLTVIRTNAQDMMIDVGKDKRDGKRFSTLEFSSIGSGNAGKVRAEGLLYCDDLVSDIQQALSKERLDTLWTQYTTDLRQRKIGNCKELHIATRWSVHDVIGRLESAYGDDEKTKFITVPALDENDKSNFDYGTEAGFTTEFYHKQREIMDDASWRALFMNQPIEREGLLYPEDELRRYFELPDGEPDAILAVCDTKDKGKDYCFMPVVYQYGSDYYLDTCVCDNGTPEVVEAQLVRTLIERNVKMAQFESNSAGGRIAEKVQSQVKERGGITKITTKYTTSNKETKIIVNSPWIKEHVLFKDDTIIRGDRTYRKMLSFLCGYTMAGKNKFDDVPDGMAQLAEYIQSLEGRKVTVMNRIF